MLKMPRTRRPIIPKPVAKILISSSVILAVIAGSGLAYTWYVGKYGGHVESAEIEIPESKPRNLLEPTKPAANANVGVAVQSLSSPVKPGDPASISIRTLPEAKCTIKVEYNKVPSTDPGLTEKVADEYGMTNWDWYVEDSAEVGVWPVWVTCAHGDKSAMVRGDLEVKSD